MLTGMIRGCCWGQVRGASGPAKPEPLGPARDGAARGPAGTLGSHVRGAGDVNGLGFVTVEQVGETGGGGGKGGRAG